MLAFIFLGSNLGLAMGTHFCGGHAMDTEVILGHADLSCGMMPEVVSDIDHSHSSIHTIPCCANEFQSLKIQDDFQSSTIKVMLEQVATFTPVVEFPDFSTHFLFYNTRQVYTPPIRTDEVTVLFQIFRI